MQTEVDRRTTMEDSGSERFLVDVVSKEHLHVGILKLNDSEWEVIYLGGKRAYSSRDMPFLEVLFRLNVVYDFAHLEYDSDTWHKLWGSYAPATWKEVISAPDVDVEVAK